MLVFSNTRCLYGFSINFSFAQLTSWSKKGQISFHDSCSSTISTQLIAWVGRSDKNCRGGNIFFVQEFYIVHNLMLGLEERLIRIVDVVIFWRGEVQNTTTELAKNCC